MSLKRQNTSSPEPDDHSPPPKRQRPLPSDDFDTFQGPNTDEKPRVDQHTGQKSAFPGLDDEDESNLLYGDPTDGIEYLRMVRSERRDVPHILVAPKETQTPPDYEEGKDYEEGDYHPDMAYIAAPERSPIYHPDEPPDAQELYYLSLINRFIQIQSALRKTPPLAAVEQLTSSQPISFPLDSKKAVQKWRHLIQTGDPSTIQLACMDNESVLELVKLLTSALNGTIRSRSLIKIKRLGRWVWSCLTKCRDRGELTSEEVGELRDLGKKAARMLETARREQENSAAEDDGLNPEKPIALEDGGEIESTKLNGVANGSPNETEDKDLSIKDEEAAELAKARMRLSGMLESYDNEVEGQELMATRGEVSGDGDGIGMDADKQSQIVLDMILTIIGDVYGQRDLLEHRDIWEEEALLE